MKILIVGVGGGSWAMRGVQLGRALGARVTGTPSAADWAWAEIVVLVKRAAITWANDAKRLSVPVVWDALDFWQQPEENGLSREDMIGKAITIARAANVSQIVCATQAMAADLGGVYLTHHCRIGLQPTPPRAKADVVGYDGTKKYLGAWAKAIDQVCARLGLRFVINPPDLRAVDVLVSFRDGQWDGWACQQWKSGVKVVNAIVAGRPIVLQQSAACAELVPVGDAINHVDFLVDALRQVSSDDRRATAYEHGRRRSESFRLENVAAQYRSILSHAARKAA